MSKAISRKPGSFYIWFGFILHNWTTRFISVHTLNGNGRNRFNQEELSTAAESLAGDSAEELEIVQKALDEKTTLREKIRKMEERGEL